jgi:hypothetical protein
MHLEALADGGTRDIDILSWHKVICTNVCAHWQQGILQCTPC